MTPPPSIIVQHYLGSPWIIGATAAVDIAILTRCFHMRLVQSAMVSAGMNLATFLIGRYILPILFSSYYLGISEFSVYIQHKFSIELTTGIGFIVVASIVVGCHGLLSSVLNYYVKLFFIDQTLPLESHARRSYQWLLLCCLLSTYVGLLSLSETSLAQWLDFQPVRLKAL